MPSWERSNCQNPHGYNVQKLLTIPNPGRPQIFYYTAKGTAASQTKHNHPLTISQVIACTTWDRCWGTAGWGLLPGTRNQESASTDLGLSSQSHFYHLVSCALITLDSGSSLDAASPDAPDWGQASTPGNLHRNPKNFAGSEGGPIYTPATTVEEDIGEPCLTV